MKKYIYLYIAVLVLFFAPVKTAAAREITNTDGELNNIVVLVEFKGDNNYFGKEITAHLIHTYNASGICDASAKNYFSEISSGKLKYSGIFARTHSGGHSVKLDNERNYYMPQTYSDLSPTNAPGAYDNGYYKDGEKCMRSQDGAKKHIDGAIRENLMVREIINKLDTAGIDAPLDNNGDGCVDNITFILSGNVVYGEKFLWGEVLWPHMTSLYSMNSLSWFDNYYYPGSDYILCNYGIDMENIGDLGDVYINGLKLFNYNVLSAAYMFNRTSQTYSPGDTPNTGVICHELMHVLGLMDYYSYEPQKIGYRSVGRFDLMGTTTKNPQYLLSYLRLKMGWINADNIAEIKKSGDYTLFPVNADKDIKALKFKPDKFDTEEYFLIEARCNNQGRFDREIGGTGIIVYRIDPAAARNNGGKGNMYGDDEIYVYRQYDAERGNYSKNNDSGLIKSGGYGSLDLKAKINTVFFQGKNLQGKNSGLCIHSVKVNDDNSVTFKIAV